MTTHLGVMILFAAGVAAVFGALLRDDPAGWSELVPAIGRIEFLDGQSIALMLSIGVLLGASASLFALRGMVRSWKAYRSAR